MYTTFWHLVGWTLVRPIGSRIDLIIRPMNQWDGIVAHSSSTSGTRVRWEEFDEKRAVLLEIEEREGKFSYKLDGFMSLTRGIFPWEMESFGKFRRGKRYWRLCRDRKIEKLEKINLVSFAWNFFEIVGNWKIWSTWYCIGENIARKISKSIHFHSYSFNLYFH